MRSNKGPRFVGRPTEYKTCGRRFAGSPREYAGACLPLFARVQPSRLKAGRTRDHG